MFHWTGSKLCCRGNQLLCASQVKGCLSFKIRKQKLTQGIISALPQKVWLGENESILAAIRQTLNGRKPLGRHLTCFLWRMLVKFNCKFINVMYDYGSGVSSRYNAILELILISQWIIWFYFSGYMIHTRCLKIYQIAFFQFEKRLLPPCPCRHKKENRAWRKGENMGLFSNWRVG